MYTGLQMYKQAPDGPSIIKAIDIDIPIDFIAEEFKI